MKKIKLLCGILVLALIAEAVFVAVDPVAVQAAEIVDSGTCGDNLYWTLYSEGTLIIGGTGPMAYYRDLTHPWSKYRSSGYDAIKTVVIYNGVTTIGDRAFSDCVFLTNVNIPNSVTTIGDMAFSDCDGLTNVTIPHSVTTIGGSAFSGCVNLTNVTIPHSVTTIGGGAFSDCDSLTSVTIPHSVTTIGGSAFSGCVNLTNVTIGNSVTTIGAFAFFGCSRLTSVTIGSSVITIGDSAFDLCSRLTTVYYAGTQSQWRQLEINNHINNTNAPLWYAIRIYDYVIEKEIPEVSLWNISLQNDIGVNFYVPVQSAVAEKIQVNITVGDEKATHDLTDFALTGNGYQMIVPIGAAQMTDEITIQIVNDGVSNKARTYTVRQYADSILDMDFGDTTKNMVRYLLNYGAAAQVYFGHKTNDLANAGLPSVPLATVPESADDLAISDNANNLDFYGASLLFRNKIAVRYYFTGDVTGYSFTANGSTYTPVAKDGMYYVEMANINPQDLDETIILTVTDAADNTLCVTYSPMTYIVRMNQKGGETIKNLMNALYNYHLAAETYVT